MQFNAVDDRMSYNFEIFSINYVLKYTVLALFFTLKFFSFNQGRISLPGVFRVGGCFCRPVL